MKGIGYGYQKTGENTTDVFFGKPDKKSSVPDDGTEPSGGGHKKNESEILSALKQDLHKSGAESYMAEVGMTLSELRYVKRHLPFWIRGSRVSTPLVHFPAKAL